MTNALRKPEYEDLTERFFITFNATAGVHVVAQKKDGQMHQFFTKDLRSQQYPDRENIFMTPNTVKKWSRRKAHACILNAITIDLDYHKTGMTKAQIMCWLPHVYDDRNIPVPTAIVDSGNGLYLMWKLEERAVNDQVMVRLYEKITKTLQAKLADIGADAQACDVLHLFRMPGTLNTKYGKRKEVFVENLDETLIYDLEYFATEVLEELPARRQKIAQTPKNGQKKASVSHLFNQYTLAVARAKDLERLAQMREYDLDGCRHSFLHIYAVQLMQSGAEDYEKKLAEMNALLARPIRESEVQALIKTLNQKAENGARVVKAIEAAKKPNDKPMTAAEKAREISYGYFNSTIIDDLGITESEQVSMRTIIGGAERRKRNRLRKETDYAPIKAANQTQKERRNERILTLKSEGFKHKEIFEIMKKEGYTKVSLRTIERTKTKASE